MIKFMASDYAYDYFNRLRKHNATYAEWDDFSIAHQWARLKRGQLKKIDGYWCFKFNWEKIHDFPSFV